MKYVFKCEKLVRDRIPDLMPDYVLDVVTLDRKAHILALKKKLKEEAEEVEAASSREEIIEEIADISEAIDALLHTLSISRIELEETKRQKSIKNGGFDRGLFLKTVEAPKDSALAERFLKDPAKYPILDKILKN